MLVEIPAPLKYPYQLCFVAVRGCSRVTNARKHGEVERGRIGVNALPLSGVTGPQVQILSARQCDVARHANSSTPRNAGSGYSFLLLARYSRNANHAPVDHSAHITSTG